MPTATVRAKSEASAYQASHAGVTGSALISAVVDTSATKVRIPLAARRGQAEISTHLR